MITRSKPEHDAPQLLRKQADENSPECHRLDTSTQVLFYENDFYVLSNFSAFRIQWGPYDFDTSEHLYHWRRFHLAGTPEADAIAKRIMHARSAHEAFKIAQANKHLQVRTWPEIKVGEMHAILRAKVDQHEYVRTKLLATGDRELIEDSWRDGFWGWGPHRDGDNTLGRLWMEVRGELRKATADLGRTGPQEAGAASPEQSITNPSKGPTP